MRQHDIPSYNAIMDTLRLAAQGYAIGPGEVPRPMPWRRILDHLSVLGPDELLYIDPSAHGSGIAVRRIVANGPAGARRSAANGARKTICAVDSREGLRARARFAQRIEMAVRSGECGCVTCVRTGPEILALTTGASVPEAPSNGHRPRPTTPRAFGGRSPWSRTTPSKRRSSAHGSQPYMLLGALLSLYFLAASIGDPLPPQLTNAIAGQVLIEGRGADGVTVTLDGGTETVTASGGAFRFDGVEAGAHTIAIADYPAHARFGRTFATAALANEGGTATVNFSGAYTSAGPVRR